jgi:trk system potassium uptake protein TrkA
MRIIIVGAGAVGSYLAERLSSGGEDVVVIEDDERRAAELQDSIDALVLHGNGASTALLEEAGVEKADLLIAVSDSDGANVLACFTARDLGAKTTIARIEDPEIREGADRLGVDVVIDPSATAAEELAGIVSSGAASELVQFADGQLVMVGGNVTPNAPITGQSLAQMRMRSAEWGWVVAALVRDGRTIVAHGDTVVRPGDHALLMTTSDRVEDAVRLLGLRKKNLDRAIIMGGTRLAELTAHVLSTLGMSVVIVDEDAERCARFASHHPSTLIICGDPTDPDVLAELTAHVLSTLGMSVVIVDEDAERCARFASHHPSTLIICGDPTDPDVLAELDPTSRDVAMALTGWDEVNVLGCLVAKAQGAGMVISRFNRISYVQLLAGVGIDAAISSRLMAASAILRFVRRGQVEQVATFSDTDAEAIEIEVEKGSRAEDKTLLDLALPVGVIVGGISRNGTTFVPDGSTVIRSGDHIIFFALPRDIEESSALFSA